MLSMAVLTLTNDSQTFSIQLQAGSLGALSTKLAENLSNAVIFDLLSQHPDFSVRAAVAGMENLSNEAVGRLALALTETDPPVLTKI